MRAILWLTVGAYLVVSAYLVWRGAVLAPYSDLFAWIERYYRLQADGDWAAYLLAPHNFHRLVWTLAVLALDIEVFGGAGWPFVAVGAACLGVTAAILAREAGRAADGIVGWASAGFALMLTLMAGNLLDASVPINTTYVHALVFAVLAIVLAEATVEETAIGPGRGGALACAAASACGNAVGLAVWPVLLFSAWRGRSDRRWILTLAAAATAFVGLYAMGQSTPGGGVQAGSLMTSIHFLLSYLGLPWTRAVPGAGWLVGLIFLGLSTAALMSKGGSRATRSERIAVQLILFSLGTALMAALGRAGSEAPWNVPLRYAVFLAPMHVGLLMLAAPYVARLRAGRERAMDAALAGAAVLMLGHQVATGMAAVRTTDINRALIAEFNAGVRTPQMIPTIYPDLDVAGALSMRMRRDRIYQAPPH